MAASWQLVLLRILEVGFEVAMCESTNGAAPYGIREEVISMEKRPVISPVDLYLSAATAASLLLQQLITMAEEPTVVTFVSTSLVPQH
jgi:hypothetical protein